MSRPLRHTLMFSLGVLVIGCSLILPGCDRPVSGVGPGREVAGSAATPAAEVPAPAEPLTSPLLPLREPSSFDPGSDGRLSLREYYLQKYPESEREAVRRVARGVLGYGGADLEDAVAEVLAYHHVVYHRTSRHDLAANHAVARRFEGTLRDVARRFDVPFLPLLAIVSWENSGDPERVSWADAAGLGQMTWGAVERAHAFAADEAACLQPLLDVARSLGQGQRVGFLERRIRALDLQGRHQEMARQAGVADERRLALCNLEDAAMFFKFLLTMYRGRTDLAISAYHNGVLNTDDILYDHLSRLGESLPPHGDDRSGLTESLERRNVTWLSLWRDARAREMLNGLRTVQGERTTSENAHMALGDESDIYLWKVVASLAAYRAGPEWTARMVERYSGRWDLVEVRGLPVLDSLEAFDRALAAGHIVAADVPLLDRGLAGPPTPGSPAGLYDRCATPEMVGYLADLGDRLRQATGNPEVALPLVNLSGAVSLGTAQVACPSAATSVHLRGVALDLEPGRLPADQARALEDLLQSDYLMDRIYLGGQGGARHVVLNPRRGDDFLAAYTRRFGATAARP